MCTPQRVQGELGAIVRSTTRWFTKFEKQKKNVEGNTRMYLDHNRSNVLTSAEGLRLGGRKHCTGAAPNMVMSCALADVIEPDVALGSVEGRQ